jgi:hypothetical protein
MATNSRGLSPNRSILKLMLFGILACGLPERVDSQDRFVEYDLVMYERPSVPQAPSRSEFPDGLAELWMKALERPDAELQRMVIDTFAIAHRKGLPDLERIQPRLLELLRQPDQRLDVVRSIVQTLIVLDARDQADLLAARSSQHGISIAQIVEPALARWQSPVMEKAWLQRVTEASSGRTLMTLAMDGLGQLQTEQAAEPLERIVLNGAENIQVRFSAAQALGAILSSGLTELAQQLIDTKSTPPDLHALLAYLQDSDTRLFEDHEVG